MYCWVSAIVWPHDGEDAQMRLLYSGEDEEEAKRVARDASETGEYSKVTAKALGGQQIFRYRSPELSK